MLTIPKCKKFDLLLYADKSKIIRIPTSSGKTRIAELAIVNALTKNSSSKCVYIAPYRSLVSELEETFISKITKQLEKLRIEVVQESHDRQDLFKIIRAVKSIIKQEKGNEIYVNLASGSKIQAIGTMMACMMFNDDSNVHPFYVEAANYPGFDAKQPLSTGIKDIQNVPPYSIQTPEPKLVSALQIIKKHGDKLTKKEMAKLSEEEEIITINAKEKNHSMARFASLDKNIIQPLEEWGFIDVEKVGRNR